jgi:hypothetical protein
MAIAFLWPYNRRRDVVGPKRVGFNPQPPRRVAATCLFVRRSLLDRRLSMFAESRVGFEPYPLVANTGGIA